MDDQRIGSIIRALRVRRNWRQSDLGRAAGVSAATISRLERGHVGQLSLAALRGVAAALDVRLELMARWRGGDLDRLLNARHSAMHEAVARRFAALPGWTIRPEVSFSVYGERGIVDVLGWHAATRTLLVVELKTEIVDVQETVGTLDRKRRLAARIARDHGWAPVQVGAWLLVAESTANRARVRAHATMLRAAYPAGAVDLRHWLRVPAGPIAALSFLGPNGGVARGGDGHGGRRSLGGAGGMGCQVQGSASAQDIQGAGQVAQPQGAVPAAQVAQPQGAVPAAQSLRNGHGRTRMPQFAPRKRVRLPQARPASATGP